MLTHLRKIAYISGFTVEQQESSWIWRNDGDVSQPFASEEEAWSDAETSAVSNVMGDNNLSSEDWDQMSEDDQYLTAFQTYSKTLAP